MKPYMGTANEHSRFGAQNLRDDKIYWWRAGKQAGPVDRAIRQEIAVKSDIGEALEWLGVFGSHEGERAGGVPVGPPEGGPHRPESPLITDPPFPRPGTALVTGLGPAGINGGVRLQPDLSERPARTF